MRVALDAAAFALPLADINAHMVAVAMDAGADIHESDGFIWSAQGMSALLALRERAEVIVAAPAALADILLGWGLGVTMEPLHTMYEVASIIDIAPLTLTEAMAHTALEDA